MQNVFCTHKQTGGKLKPAMLKHNSSFKKICTHKQERERVYMYVCLCMMHVFRYNVRILCWSWTESLGAIVSAMKHKQKDMNAKDMFAKRNSMFYFCLMRCVCVLGSYSTCKYICLCMRVCTCEQYQLRSVWLAVKDALKFTTNSIQ